MGSRKNSQKSMGSQEPINGIVTMLSKSLQSLWPKMFINENYQKPMMYYFSYGNINQSPNLMHSNLALCLTPSQLCAAFKPKHTKILKKYWILLGIMPNSGFFRVLFTKYNGVILLQKVTEHGNVETVTYIS